MSESCRENLPLLCDDYSDEEFRIRKSSPKLQRLFRYSTSGRARTQAIGAAAIITRWPEHFSSLLTYWWIGLGMIAFMIFVMYNSIVAISMLPPTHHRPLNLKTQYISDHGATHDTDIFMHIFVTNYEEININGYLPYIDSFTQKYPNFKHNLVVIIRDESNDSLNDLSDEQNNEMALNSLWTHEKKINKIKLLKNTNIKIVSLTKYMDDSPLKKYWRRLPQQFFGFLTRCIAIWEKGGIAFDPLILTPNSPNSGYIENLERVIANLSSEDLNKSTKRDRLKISKKKVNNIRDIIENLKNQDDNYSVQENLSVAENKIILSKINNLNIYDNKIKRSTKDIQLEKYKKIDLYNIHTNKSRDFYVTEYLKNGNKNSVELSKDQESNHLSSTNGIKNKYQINDEMSTKRNLLPMFLEYLYHQPDNVSENTKEQKSTIKNFTLSNHIKNFSTKNVTKNQANNSIIMTSFKKKGSIVKVDTEIIPSEKDNIVSLSIDLKGNLVATKTSCHAFIGTIFSNALHHSDDESIADFIITELSIFCKGVLSSCKGIDIILL
ncbi:uncharacterized protein LOC126770537 [Nymphalis io]|uniref:uncharacterized protein LOC126770537 n=1 Tax=Inachis io TaxID=171585 RepID=UPI002169C6BB|nr:uncharacterized protein LOC126770537 [Nymphalis io]XP_050345934.1 uncharacterized protein LOC126770537 [Nymphalis io]